MADSPPPLDDVEIKEAVSSEPAPNISDAANREQDDDENLFADALQSPQATFSEQEISSDTAPLLEESPIEPEPAKTEEPSAPPPTLEPTVAVQKESPEVSQKAPTSDDSASAKPVMDLFGEDEESEKEKVGAASRFLKDFSKLI